MSSKPKWSTRVDRVKLEETDEVVGEIMETSALRFGLVVGIVLGRTDSNITHAAYLFILFIFRGGEGCYSMRKHRNIKVSRCHRVKTATDSLRQIVPAKFILIL